MRNQVQEQIINLHSEMRELTLEAGIPVKKYDLIVTDLEEASDQEIQEIQEWLLNIFLGEYKELKTIKDLLPQHIWDRYDLFKITGLREQGLLKETKSDLRKAWENPYFTEKQKKRKASKKSPIKHKKIIDIPKNQEEE